MKKPLRKQNQHVTPQSLWKGPEQDGITFSLLSKFLVCRERFRLKVVEGLEEDEGFSPALEFGNYWHEAEEAHSGGKDWRSAMVRQFDRLRQQYPGDEEENRKLYNVAKVTFPIYVNHYKKEPEERQRKPILEEKDFRIPYVLPSGRTVVLRGKFDCVFRNGRSIWLQENKTKGKIDHEGITKTVDRNLQTMLYQIALRQAYQGGFNDKNMVLRGGKYEVDDYNAHFSLGTGIIRLPTFKRGQMPKIAGTLYNVVRRPLADQHAIKQRKGRLVKGNRVGAETEAQFYKRLTSVIQEEQKEYFFRWKVPISTAQIETFKKRSFDPALEQLCDWWEHISYCLKFNVCPFVSASPVGRGATIHYQTPWGVYNSLASGFRGDFFEFLTSGSRSNLRRVKTLYPELETAV